MRVTIVATALLLALVLALVFHRKLLAIFRNYFAETDYAVNLAVYRIVLFATMIVTFDFHSHIFFSGLSRDLRFVPEALGPAINALPASTEIATVTGWAYLILCFLACIGLFARASAFGAFLLSTYTLGIPQLYGKVDHYHHLVWFALLLSLSPIADTLSVDARLRKTKIDTDQPSVKYALPLRLTWLLIGIAYVFPGFWKLAMEGDRWLLMDGHLQRIIYDKSIEYASWQPPLVLDNLPILLRLGAVGTLFFELGWLPLILFRKTRPLAALIGLTFHNLTWLTMLIPFIELQPLYLTFINWKRKRSEPTKQTTPLKTKPLIIAAAAIAAGNVYMGVRDQGMAWPIVSYPSFSGPYLSAVSPMLEIHMDDKWVVPLWDPKLYEPFTRDRLRGLIQKIVTLEPGSPEQHQALIAFADKIAQLNPEAYANKELTFVKSFYRTPPKEHSPIEETRELLLRISP